MANENWMKSLADYYETVRNEIKNLRDYNKLLVLFDIDGTILDHRKTIFHLLKEYDRVKSTNIFEDLRPEDIYVSQDHLHRLLDQYELSPDRVDEIVSFYEDNRWSEEVILESHQPYQGVMDVIRWFQLQPHAQVGLNTARPEELREKTLKSLNLLGEEYKVSFKDDLLHMNSNGWTDPVETKIEGIRYFEDQGYRIVAMLDNEPANLSALSEADFSHDFLLLHAATCFDTDEELLPERSLSGEDYGITGLIQSQADPDRVQFIWDNIDTPEMLDLFLNSTVNWGKFPVRRDPDSGEYILRSEDFNERPRRKDNPLGLEDALDRVSDYEKSIQFEMNVGPEDLKALRDTIEEYSLSGDSIGFRFSAEKLHSKEVDFFLSSYPKADVELPVDFLKELLLSEAEKSRIMLEMFQEKWSVNRFSLTWQTYGKSRIVRQLKDWDLPVNLTNIPGLAEFLGAERLLPDSVTLTPTFTKPDSKRNRSVPKHDVPTQFLR